MSEQYFRHIDGGLYRFVAHARSADDACDVVVYEHLWPFDQSLWVRKKGEFEERFTPIDEVTVKRAMTESRDAVQERVDEARALRRATKNA